MFPKCRGRGNDVYDILSLQKSRRAKAYPLNARSISIYYEIMICSGIPV